MIELYVDKLKLRKQEKARVEASHLLLKAVDQQAISRMEEQQQSTESNIVGVYIKRSTRR